LHPEDQFAVRMLKTGAAGYLTKESAAEELVGAIRKVVAGGRYISPSLAERMVSYLDMDLQKPSQRAALRPRIPDPADDRLRQDGRPRSPGNFL